MSLMKRMASIIKKDMEKKAYYDKTLSYGNNKENYANLKEMAIKKIMEHLKDVQETFNAETYTFEEAAKKVWSNNYVYDYFDKIVLDDVVLHNYDDENYEQEDYNDMENTLNTLYISVFINSSASLEQFEKDAQKGKVFFRVVLRYTNTARDNYEHPDSGESKGGLREKDVSLPINFIIDDGPSFNSSEDMYDLPTTIEIDYKNLPIWL